MGDPERVLYEYFDRIDRRDPEAAAALFTADARAEIMTGKVLEGRDRIGRALGRVLAAYARTSHHATNLRAERDGDRVVLHSHVYAYHRMAVTGATWHLWARLRDVLVPAGDGWLIADHTLIGVDSVPARRDIPDAWYAGHPGREWEPLPSPGGRAREAIAAASPQPAAGMALLREASGALAPAQRGLVTACAAAARGEGQLLREALEQAAAGGLPAEEGWAAPAVLLLSRGEAAAGRLAEALLEIYGPPPAGEPYAGPFDPDEAFAYFREYFGEVPERVALLAERAPAAFEGYTLVHRGALREGPLAPVLAELILCGVNAAEYQTQFVAIHAGAARRAGATEQEILEAVLAVIPVAGVAAWPSAAAALASA